VDTGEFLAAAGVSGLPPLFYGVNHRAEKD